ncbi:MAG: murein tripeptide amidase MpaA [Xanthomonadales bacterium]
MNSEADTNWVPRARRGVVRHAPQRYGTSVHGAALNVFGPTSGPVDLLVMAAMHGDECESTVVLSEALRSVPEAALATPVILSVNPDGTVLGTRANARGVDLNRNWPTRNWAPDAVHYKAHGETVRDIELSPGATPASEPETAALLDLVRELQPAVVVSLHAPLGCVEDPDRKPLAHWIAGEVGLPLVPDVGYLTPGSFGTWSVEQGINIITWELPPEPLPALLASHAPVLRRLLTGDYPRARDGHGNG